MVVKIDDVTFDDLNVQWPFARSQHGEVIRLLSKATGTSTIEACAQLRDSTGAIVATGACNTATTITLPARMPATASAVTSRGAGRPGRARS